MSISLGIIILCEVEGSARSLMHNKNYSNESVYVYMGSIPRFDCWVSLIDKTFIITLKMSVP